MRLVAADNSSIYCVAAQQPQQQRGNWAVEPRGRPGFDGGVKSEMRVEGAAFLVNPAAKQLVANDDNYALAA